MGTFSAIVLWASLATAADTRIVEFGQPNCANCRQMDAVVRRLQSNGITVERVNALEQIEAAQQLGVTGTPTYIVFVNGQPTQRIAGAASYDRLLELAGGSPAPTPNAPPAPAPGPASLANSPRNAQPAAGSSAAPSTAQPSTAQPPAPNPLRSPPGNALPSTPKPAPNIAGANVSPAAEQRALQATVRLRIVDETGTSVASGTIVDLQSGNALIVTCAHVFRASRGKGKIQVDLFVPGAGEPLEGELVDFDFYRDVAVVSVQPKLPVRPVPIASLDQAGDVATNVFSVGCDNGGQPSIERSRITRLNRYTGPPNVEVSGAPSGGRSGGGLFSVDGALIGVCNAANEPENEGIYAALPTVHWQLAQVGLERLVPPANPGSSPSRTAIAEDRRGATPADSSPAPASGGSDNNQPAELLEASDHVVTVHVKSKSRPTDPGQTFILERPSPQLMEHITRNARPAGFESPAGPSAAEIAGNEPPAAAPPATQPPAMRSPTMQPPTVQPPPGASFDPREPRVAQPAPGAMRSQPLQPEIKSPVMRGQQPSGGWWPFRK